MQCQEISIYTLSVVHAELTSPHRFHANGVVEWLPADRSPMSPRVEGGWAVMTGRVPSSPAPGPRQASGSMSSRHSKNTMTAKERDMGTQEPMQFTCSSFGQQGEEDEGWGGGAIKILQINYTKKKKKGKLFIRNLYKAFTSPSSFVRTLQGKREQAKVSMISHNLKRATMIWKSPSEFSTNLRS